MTSDNEENSLIEKQAVHKKAYHSPNLSHFGTVSQLTHTGGMGPSSDAGMNMMGVS